MDALENAVNVLAEKSKSIGYITDDDIMETIDACNVPTMKIEKLMELLLSANVHIEENTYDGNEN